MKIVIIALLAIIVSISTFLLAGGKVRWLYTNVAATSADDPDPELRPVLLSISIEEGKEKISQSLCVLPRWTTSNWEGHTLHATHSTQTMNFIDDVTVTVTPTKSGILVNATSASRVGIGDLGQNERNIKELLNALKPADPTQSA
jgi:uncharacterized protein (DUF1499 family)